MNTILYLLLGVSILSLIFQILNWLKPTVQPTDITPKVQQFSASLARIENESKNYFKLLHDASSNMNDDNRDEFNTKLNELKQELGQTLKDISEQNQKILSMLSEGIEPPMFSSNKKIDTNATEDIEQIVNDTKEISECNTASLDKLNDKIEMKINDLSVRFIIK